MNWDGPARWQGAHLSTAAGAVLRGEHVKTKRQTPQGGDKGKQSREATAEDFGERFDCYAKQIIELANRYAERQHDPELAKQYLTYKQVVTNWRSLAQKHLKDCPTLPEPAALIESDYFGAMIHLETCCKSCAAILRGKDKQAEPTKPVVPTETQRDILKYLDRVGVAVAQADIANKINKAENTTAKEIKELKKMSYVSAPSDKKYFVGITQQGRDYLKSVEQSTS